MEHEHEHKHKHKHKHLHELLQEDQEPFHIKDYIEHKRFQLKRLPSNFTRLPFQKPHQDYFNLCQNVCFFTNSYNPTNSPLFEFASPPKQAPNHPKVNSDRIVLHVSPTTSALLLEAALRIQNTTPITPISNSPKTKAFKSNNAADGLFASILKRLSNRNRNRNRNQNQKGNESMDCGLAIGGRKSFEKEASGSCTRSSSRSSSEFVDVEEVCCSVSNGEFGVGKEGLCGSPFRFVLQGSPSSGHRTPEFSSPPTSRQKSENKETCDGTCLKTFLIAAEEEEEKEQCSPVSILDPPFDDDVDGNDHANEGEDNDSFDYECSYAIVQRAKQHLLNKLYRFEKLAELDPIELEKRIQELDADDSEAGDDKQEDQIKDDETLLSDEEFVSGVIRSAFVHSCKFPKHRIKLVSDLISEEEEEESELKCNDQDALVKRVCQRLESWKKGHCCTIHMMVDKDLREEFDWWKKNLGKTEDIALEIELAIFSLLIEELSTDLAA